MMVESQPREVPPPAVVPATIRMARAVLGFDQYRHFRLEAIPDAPPFVLLQSTEAADVAFIAVPPGIVHHDYAPEIPAWAVETLHLDDPAEAVVLALVTLDSDGGGTVNLRAPIVVHPRSGEAAQVVVDDKYPLRAPLKVG